MTQYPVFSLVLGIVVALLAATMVGGALARHGFPLPKGGRFEAIDGLRGYLALSVLAHHFVIWFQITRLGMDWVAPKVGFFNQLGAGSVALFFMTTGFLFYPILQTGWRATNWREFLLKRLFRIEPVVLISVALVALVVGLRQDALPDHQSVIPILNWLSSRSEPPLFGDELAGRVNAYVLWSLRYEWFFYLLLLPSCAVASDLLRGRFPVWTIPLALLSVGLIKMVLGIGGGISFLPLFAIGMLAQEARGKSSIVQIMNQPFTPAIAALGLLASIISIPTPYLWALPGFSFFFLAVASGNSFGVLFSNKGAQVLGACSFGIYTIHGIVLSLIFTEGAGLTQSLSGSRLVCLLPVASVIVVILSAALHLTVEAPGIALGKSLARRR